MFDLNTFFALAATVAGWVTTTQGSNALFAAIYAAVLLGLNVRICVVLTLFVHLILMLI